MLLYLLFWTILGFIFHFYIIFGTNLLTGGPAQNCCFLPISVFRRNVISNGVQTEWNLREHDFWNKRDPEELQWTSSNQRGGHEAGAAPIPLGTPSTLVTASFVPWSRVQVSWITFGEKITFPKVLFRLDSVWYSVSSKYWNRQKTAILGWASG